MKWFLFCMKKYATFKGRASRAEYWSFTLIVAILNVGCRAVMTVSPQAGALILIIVLFNFGLILPHAAVGTRRLHDIGRSGWWLAPVALLAAFLGATGAYFEVEPGTVRAAWIVARGLALVVTLGLSMGVLYFLVQAGDPSPNRYGDLPPSAPG